MVLYPKGYGTTLVTLDELRAWDHDKHHPEFERRLFAWLESRGGMFGIGDGWRLTQPDKPGVAPDGQSFHQFQTFASGLVRCCAVDLVVRNPGKVHRAPLWVEVPAQGSPEAAMWGVHCNVGIPGVLGSEPWHMQPIEIDGWNTWVLTGRPDPTAGYPLPTDPPEEPDVAVSYFKLAADGLSIWATSDGLNASRLEASQANARGVDVFKVPVLPATEAEKFVYHFGAPRASVR
jgi:hypothetical protein